MNPNFRMHLMAPIDGGGRLLKIEDDASGLSLERKLDPTKPVVAQKEKLLRLFEALLQSELAIA